MSTGSGVSIRLPRVPTLDDKKVENYLNSLNTFLMRELSARVHDNTARNGILLVSPGGVVYNVTVNDAGTLVSTAVFNPIATP